MGEDRRPRPERKMMFTARTLRKALRLAAFGEAFSEAEIQERLREASRVTWKRTPNYEPGELNWTGEQNGKIIFDANEANNGRGIYLLTIPTR